MWLSKARTTFSLTANKTGVREISCTLFLMEDNPTSFTKNINSGPAIKKAITIKLLKILY